MSAVLTFEEELEIELELARMRSERGDSAIDIPQVFWQPEPDNKPQQAAYVSQADVLGYGGAAGGGKSDLLIGLAFTKHRVVKIFRREAAQLNDLIDRARELVGDKMNLKGVCRFDDGRRIQLLGVKDQKDVDKHKGRPADLFGFDEATEFSEGQIRFLLGWNRSATPGQRCRAVLCFNPPTTAEGRWILQYFAAWLDPQHPNPAQPGELRYYARLNSGEEVERENGDPFYDGGELMYPRSRSFIPAKLSDNPHLANTDYRAVLQQLPEPLRSQMLHGSFLAGIKEDPWQVIPTLWVQLAQARWIQSGGQPPSPSLDAVGVDVSRGGADKTVIARRYGTWFAEPDRFEGLDTDNGRKVAQLVVQSINRFGPQRVQPDINIDATGVGTSPYDFLIASGLIVNAIHNGEGADEEARDRSGKLKFYNRRAQNYWKFMEALHPDFGDNLALPPDPKLLADLCSAHWEMTPRGIKIELKPEIAKRISRSPDDGDAYINAWVKRVVHPGHPAVAGQRRTSGFTMR